MKKTNAIAYEIYGYETIVNKISGTAHSLLFATDENSFVKTLAHYYVDTTLLCYIHYNISTKKIKPSVGNLSLDNNDGNNPITVIVDASGLTITKTKLFQLII